MSVQHHEGGQGDKMRRFIDEVAGRAQREFPDGRVSPEDDGSLSYAITNDDRHRIIKIVFSKPTAWIGLDAEAATQLRDSLTERILALRGVTT